ncbi:MAG: hypothetical protein AAGB31_15255 [Bdellovibrio sp.]
MSTKDTTFEKPFQAYATHTNEAIRDFWGWQMKTGQEMFDQGLRYAQACTDFAQTQWQESTRLSQEVFKIGLSNMEEMKKTFTTHTTTHK